MGTEFPAPKWAVPGYLVEGLNFVVGKPKIGKSWFTLGIAVAVEPFKTDYERADRNRRYARRGHP